MNQENLVKKAEQDIKEILVKLEQETGRSIESLGLTKIECQGARMVCLNLHSMPKSTW